MSLSGILRSCSVTGWLSHEIGILAYSDGALTLPGVTEQTALGVLLGLHAEVFPLALCLSGD